MAIARNRPTKRTRRININTIITNRTNRIQGTVITFTTSNTWNRQKYRTTERVLVIAIVTKDRKRKKTIDLCGNVTRSNSNKILAIRARDLIDSNTLNRTKKHYFKLNL